MTAGRYFLLTYRIERAKGNTVARSVWIALKTAAQPTPF